MSKEISRRDLLIKGGALAATGALVTAGGLSLTGLAEAAKKEDGGYPYPYKKMNPQKSAEIAYNNWYKNFCAYGAASGIIIPQRNLVGGQWNSFPIMSVKFGEGGVQGWGTLCGTLLGASVAISLAAGHEGEPMINDLMDWYGSTMQPVFEPAKPRAQFKNKTMSNSPLCHISVGKWMQAENKGLKSPERKDRCARLAASVAYQSAVMLNAWADGKYKPAYSGKQSDCGITSQNNCTECHGDNIPNTI